MAAQDPFYLVRDEIQDSVSKLQETFGQFERLPASSPERESLSKAILADCDSIEWEVHELDRAVGVAAKDPARFNIDQAEIDVRRKWTNTTRHQLLMIRQAIQAAAAERAAMQKEAARRELLRTQATAAAAAASAAADGGAAGSSGGKGSDALRKENESFISSEDDRQALIMREQDEQLDAMSQSLARIGGMGIAIHEELGSQDALIGDLGEGMDKTSGRLELIQKKMVVVLKRVGIKGQLCILVGLIVAFIILIILIIYG